MNNNAVQKRIIENIKDPILLTSISFGLFVTGLGVYSYEKLSKLIIPLIILYLAALFAVIMRDYFGVGRRPNIDTDTAKTGIRFIKRKDLLDEWIDEIQGSETLIVVNGISRKHISDIATMSKFKKYLTKCQKAIIIWDSKFNQTTRFFQIKESDPDFSIVDLKKHLDEKIDFSLKALCELKSANPSTMIKVLPFPVSYTFLKVDAGIYVTLLGAKRGSNGPTFFVDKFNVEFYEFFNLLINKIVLLSADVEYDFDKQVCHISEFLQLVDKKGNLLTTLPRQFIEDLNFTFNERDRKNLAHRHVYCFVVSPEAKLLIQKRGKKRDNGDLWDKSIGGHVQYEESLVSACIRELKEELGVDVDLDRHRLSLIERQVEPIELKRLLYKDGVYVESVEYSAYELFLLYGVQENEVEINECEVSDFTWVDINEIDKFINAHPDQTTGDLKRLSKSVEKILQNFALDLGLDPGKRAQNPDRIV